MEAILREPRRFAFFQAIRLLELCQPEAVRLGGSAPAEDEAVRLRPDTSFTYPRSQVSSVDALEDPRTGRRRFRVTETLIGLYGLQSPMPSIYGEEILLRGKENDPVRDFLDLFHHRMLSLLYRAWARSRAEALYHEGGDDPLSGVVFCLAGLPGEFLPGDLPFYPESLARYSHLFLRKARGAEGLETILSDFLGDTPVRLEPYALRFVTVPPNQRNLFGRANCTLGLDFTLGEMIPDVGGKFRLWLGPMDHSAYLELAPLGGARAGAGALVHLYLGDALDHELMLGILGPSKPEFRLATEPGSPRLGIDTWLCATEPRSSWELFPALPGARLSPSTGRQEKAT